jgi:hypothetical protein
MYEWNIQRNRIDSYHRKFVQATQYRVTKVSLHLKQEEFEDEK